MLSLSLPVTLAFAPMLGGRTASRPTLRQSMSRPVVMGCSDSICYSISSAKPSALSKLLPDQLGAEIDLLEQRLANAKRVQEGLPALDTLSAPKASLDDSVSWALANAKPAGLEKLSSGARGEQIELLEKQLEAAKSVQSGTPVAAPPPAPVEMPSVVESAPAAVEVPSVVESVPEPPPVAAVPEPAVEAPQAAAQNIQDAFDAGDAYFGLPEKVADKVEKIAPTAPTPSADSGPFGFSLPSAPKLPEFGGVPKMPSMPDGSAVELPGSGGGGGGGLFGFLGGGGGGGGLELPSAPAAPDLGALSMPSVSASSVDLAASSVPWGLFVIPFVVLPVLVIGGSKALEMAGVLKPPAPED